MSYRPPADIWEVNEQLQWDEPLPEGDPRYVETARGRGDAAYRNTVLRTFGVNPKTMTLVKPKPNCYMVFCGHRGCGKSTELKRLASALNGPSLFFVVFVNTLGELDPNNMQYPDVLMALAKALADRLMAERIDIDQVFLTRLERWFGERIEKHVKTRDFASQVKTELKLKSGIPLIGSLMAALTNSFKINATYKDELRTVIKNNFSEFADAFNMFIRAAETKLAEQSLGRRIIFVVDGTDRLRGDDSKRFFIEDIHQLQAISSYFIYCCPIHLLHEGSQLHSFFRTVVLPMVKVREQNGDVGIGYETMKEMLLRRVDPSLFDSRKTLDEIIHYSGGNPREMLRLLEYAFTFAEGDIFDQAAVAAAVRKLATEYKYFLAADDYRILHAIDHNQRCDWESERENFLLYNMALMEYNSYWRATHPVVRSLKEYQEPSPKVEG